MSEQPSTRKAVPVDAELYSQYRNCDRWAIIVGISRYQHSGWNLKYADRDAEELYKLLLTSGGGNYKRENIRKLTNEQATTRSIFIELHDFLKKPAREDVVLLYFACHGSPDPDRPRNLYLLTHDTEPSRIAGTALPMREIELAIKETLFAEKVIVLIDTCHSGGISREFGYRSASDDSAHMKRYLQELSKARAGTALLTSAETSQVARESDQWGGGHGVFTHYLLEGMRGAADEDNNGIVTIGELFEYVRENVKRATSNNQHPVIGSNFDRLLPIAIVPNTNFSQPPSRDNQESQSSQSASRTAVKQGVRETLDLSLEIALTPNEMLNGTKKIVDLVDGRIRVTVPPGLSPGKFIRLIGKGTSDPVSQQKGDLLLKVIEAKNVSNSQVDSTACKLILQRAEQLIADGDYPRAIESLQNALQIEPSNSLSHSLLGKIYLKNNQITMAKIHFNNALRIDPKNSIALEGLNQLK